METEGAVPVDESSADLAHVTDFLARQERRLQEVCTAWAGRHRIPAVPIAAIPWTAWVCAAWIDVMTACGWELVMEDHRGRGAFSRYYLVLLVREGDRLWEVAREEVLSFPFPM